MKVITFIALFLSFHANAFEGIMKDEMKTWISSSLQNTQSKSYQYIETREKELDEMYGGRAGDHDKTKLTVTTLIEEMAFRPRCYADDSRPNWYHCESYQGAEFLITVPYSHSFSGGFGYDSSTFKARAIRTFLWNEDENGTRHNEHSSDSFEFIKAVNLEAF